MLKQIKSKQRVKEKGEVFTNPREVNAMLDLIPEITIEQTFLEPSCGNGNFLVEILRRKLDLCHCPKDVSKALRSIFGIDIMFDNVNESRQRLVDLCMEKCNENLWELPHSCIQIVKKNIVCGDFLTKLDRRGNKIWFLE